MVATTREPLPLNKQSAVLGEIAVSVGTRRLDAHDYITEVESALAETEERLQEAREGVAALMAPRDSEACLADLSGALTHAMAAMQDLIADQQVHLAVLARLRDEERYLAELQAVMGMPLQRCEVVA